VTDDIVERLRDGKNWLNGGACCGDVDDAECCAAPACIFGEALKQFYEAADEIERLTRERDEAFQKYVDANEARIDAEAKVARLREALKPFAEAASMTADGFPDHDIMPMRLGQCRDARTALQEAEQ